MAVERDGTAGIVIAGHHIGDAVGVAIGIDDGGDGQAEAPRLLDGDILLVGIDHEQEVGKPAHILDAAERAVELVTLALEREALLLGVALGRARGEHLLELAQPRGRARPRVWGAARSVGGGPSCWGGGPRARRNWRLCAPLFWPPPGRPPGPGFWPPKKGAPPPLAPVSLTACSARCSIGTDWA